MELDKKYIYWGLGAVGVVVVYYLISSSGSTATAATTPADMGQAVLGSPYVSMQGALTGGTTDTTAQDKLANVQLELGKIQLANEQALQLGQLDLQKAQLAAQTQTATLNAESAKTLQQQQVDVLGFNALLQSALNPGETRKLTDSSGATITATSTLASGTAAQQLEALYSGLANINLSGAQLAKIQASGKTPQELAGLIVGSQQYQIAHNTQLAQITQAYQTQYGESATQGIVNWIQTQVGKGRTIQQAVTLLGRGVTPKQVTKYGSTTAAIEARRKIVNEQSPYTQVLL